MSKALLGTAGLLALLAAGAAALLWIASLKPVAMTKAEQGKVGPLIEFFRREGGAVVLLFVLVHKLGDTLANLTLRLLFEDLGFTKMLITTHRQNYLLPPRAHRSFPLAELL